MPGNTVRIGTQVTGARAAASELDQLKDKFTKLQSQGAKGFAIGVGAAVTTKALSLLGSAVGGVTDLIGDSTQAFIEDQHSIQQLGTSLRANIAAWDGNTDAIEGVLAARMKLGFSDDEQRASLALLVAATHDVDEALRVEAVAMDLARFKGISLAEASEALTKVEAGSFRVLKSLGIVLKEGATQADALAAVEKVAAGQAEDFADTLEGRLLVSAVRTHEAEEKLGQVTAELSADFEEAKAGAIEYAASGLDFLADGINAANQSYDRQLELQAQVIAMNPFLTQAQKDAAIAQLQLALNTYMAHRAFVDVGDSGMRFAETLEDGSPAVTGFTRDMADLEKEAEDTERAIDDLATTIEDELFGDAINAGNEARLKESIRDLEKQRAEVKKGTPAWIELTGEIAENRKRLFELHLEEAAKAGPLAAIKFLQKEMINAGDARDEIADLIKKYKALAALQGELGPIIVPSGGGHGPAKHRASGGPVSQGVAYTVGEQGPETFVAPSNGTIIPNGGASGGSGMGSPVININVSTPLLTPGAADALGRVIEPIVTRALQKRGHLAPARAF